MKKERILTRRTALAATVGAGSAGLLGLATPNLGAAKSRRAPTLNLEDPAARARIRAKVSGSAGAETVYTFCRLHLYLWLNEGNLIPMVTMANLNVTNWEPQANGNYKGKVHEVGVYTKFDTDELIDTWKNPVTGEEREVWQFVGGPLSVEIGPDGIVTLKPKPMRIDQFGDMVLVPSQSAFSFPNPMKPERWPKEAGGPTYFWDSHYVFGARASDVMNPRISSAPAFVQFQNLVSFHPWIGMGQKPGRTYGKAYGSKLATLDELPPVVRGNLEKKTPEIFNIGAWTKPRLDFIEYMQQRKPT
jgi:mannose-6-phosphate isomerase-like protein (cupin superfamily)